MKSFLRVFAFGLWLGCACAAWSQMPAAQKIDRVDIKFRGPASVSEQFIRSNLRLKAGSLYHPESAQDEVQALYATGQFLNIRVTADQADDGGVILTYILQARPRISEIKLVGNKKVNDSKLKKKITVKVGEPLDEQKLFTDSQEMEKLYEKYGYPGSRVDAIPTTDELNGRATVTFQITESPKVKITRIEFIGAAAYPQKVLRKQLKTVQHWMFSWLTGSGVFKQDDYDDDRNTLADYYRSHGYLDFEIKDVKFDHPTPNTLVLRFFVFEGRQYKVGAISFAGATLLPTNAVTPEFKSGPEPKPKTGPAHKAWADGRQFSQAFTMKSGGTFTPDGLEKDRKAIEDFYGSRGYIEVAQGQALNDRANPQRGQRHDGFEVPGGGRPEILRGKN